MIGKSSFGDAMCWHGMWLMTPCLAGLLSLLSAAAWCQLNAQNVPFQYEAEGIRIPGAWDQEPLAGKFSRQTALSYLDEGARAWTESRDCISCHTNGSYGLIRPMLTASAGPPPDWLRSFLVEELKEQGTHEVARLRQGIRPTQLVYLAANLASWDRNLAKACSPETDRALRLMFESQDADGSFANDRCWPPLESSAFQSATVAALAVAMAPGWFEDLAPDDPVRKSLKRLRRLLTQSQVPHDYARVWLLWVSALLPEWFPDARRDGWLRMIQDLQGADGGWSLRRFASAEAWGDGSRAERLGKESESERLASDGHMTGLVSLVLRQFGFDLSYPPLAAGLKWLETNQRISGRWWTRSLNTDRYHFITFSGSCYALAALDGVDSTTQAESLADKP